METNKDNDISLGERQDQKCPPTWRELYYMAERLLDERNREIHRIRKRLELLEVAYHAMLEKEYESGMRIMLKNYFKHYFPSSGD